MGRHLGDIGATERPAHEETFNYLDEKDLKVHPDLTNLLLVDFLRKARTVDDTDPAAMDTLMEVFTGLVHPDDFDRFWSAALRGRQQVVDLMRVVYKLLEELSDLPTSGRSASSPGRPRTSRRSKDDSSSRVIGRLEKQGRPDLAVIVRDAQQAG